MKSRWVFRLYNVVILLTLPLILLVVMVRWRKRFARGLERWGERWGRLAPEKASAFRTGGWWWVHAVSLGEVKSIEVFLREIPARAGARVLLSVVTPEALAWAAEKGLADELIAAPIDLPWVVRRAFAAVKPKLFITVESEFWPTLMREAKRSGARVVLVNGRISEHSFRAYRRVAFILSALWECFDLLAVRQQEDASRFRALGVPDRLVHVTGNLKYDLPLPEPANGLSPGAAARLTVVVGSSREGEEKQLLPVMERLRAIIPSLRVIWAPRHIERVDEIESLFALQTLPCARKSQGFDMTAAHILWDSMGDLLDAYKQADIALVGGSFVQKGGQNPIEPASLSLPVIFGPSMENFHGIAEVLVQQGGAQQVDLPGLQACLARLLADAPARREMGRRARAAVESRQGATDKTLALLKGLARA